MDENTANKAPMTPKGKNDSSVGSVVGIIIIIVVIIVGGLYFWGQRLTNENELTQDEIEKIVDDEQDSTVDALNDVSKSDEFDAIEDDLNSSDFESGIDNLEL